MNPQTAVREFHETYGVLVNDVPVNMSEVPQELFDLRISLIKEEFKELMEAIENRDIIETADALSDLVYVTYGTAVSLGIPLDDCFDEVHRSNMSKLDEDGKPIYREDGKVLKGPNYTPPDLAEVLFF